MAWEWKSPGSVFLFGPKDHYKTIAERIAKKIVK